MTLNRLIVLFFLLMASSWVALANGQPLFMADSTAYVRGPDFAVVYFFGPKFATAWTQERTLQESEHRHANETSTGQRPQYDGLLNSPYNKSILTGRSVYYGALLYVSHLASQMWLTVFIQAAIFIYLLHTLAINCLRLPFFAFAGISTILLVLSPVSFFISFLTPDVFASFLIVGAATLLSFWCSLARRDRLFLSAIVLYATLTHTSHLLLLIGIGGLSALVGYFAERKSSSPRSYFARHIVILAVIAAGILGELAFSYGARHTVGADPIRPPFVMARIIADGPGYKFMQQKCAVKPYVVCKFMDRLPAPSSTFLWSTNPKTGIFNVADLPTRAAMASEQTAFLFDVFRFDPLGVTLTSTKNFVDQLGTIGLRELFIDRKELQEFKDKLPDSYYSGMEHARLVLRDWIKSPLKVFYSASYFLSFFALVLTWAFWARSRLIDKLDVQLRRRLFNMTTIVIAATVFNAAICGALSEAVPRYQTRIAWIPLFILLLVAASLWESCSGRSLNSNFVGRLSNRLPQPLRFIGIGAIGLATDLATFTIFVTLGPKVLIARLGSLAVATLITWRLNRALTFHPSGRRQHEEAVRYIIVTMIAQGTSYAIFAALALTVLASLPQAAIVIGAAVGAALSYNGHRLLSFAPKTIYTPSC